MRPRRFTSPVALACLLGGFALVLLYGVLSSSGTDVPWLVPIATILAVAGVFSERAATRRRP